MPSRRARRAERAIASGRLPRLHARQRLFLVLEAEAGDLCLRMLGLVHHLPDFQGRNFEAVEFQTAGNLGRRSLWMKLDSLSNALESGQMGDVV